MRLEKQYRADVIKYNLGEPFRYYKQYYTERPDVFDLEKLIDTINELNPDEKNFVTKVEVLEIYEVINP